MIGIIVSPDRDKTKINSALKEFSIDYKFIDIFSQNWREYNYNAIEGFLIYPSAYSGLWKETLIRRVEFLIEKYNIVISPSLNSIKLYEKKIAMYDFMNVNDIPYPLTKVYFNFKKMKEDIKEKEYPLFIKADGGSGAANIIEVSNKKDYSLLINRIFLGNYRYKKLLNFKQNIIDSIYRYVKYFKQKNGYIIPKDDFYNSYVIEQEKINIYKEWRIINIDNSYFIHAKGKGSNGYHSGSKLKEWKIHNFKVLNLAKEIFENNSIYDASIDIFEDTSGNLLVNEIQCIFGTSLEYQMKINGEIGRYIYDDEWIFEEGDFCRNGCNNLRIESILNRIDKRK